MQTHYKRELGLLLVGYLLMTLSGCAPRVTTTTVTSLQPLSDADSKATRNGVTVQVIPINPTNNTQYPELACSYRYMKKSALFGDQAATAKLDNILPGLTFALKVTNNTNHIIKMAGSDIGLTAAGKDVRQMTVEQVLQVWRVNYPENMPPEIAPCAQGIPLWDERAKVLPGKSM